MFGSNKSPSSPPSLFGASPSLFGSQAPVSSGVVGSSNFGLGSSNSVFSTGFQSSTPASPLFGSPYPGFPSGCGSSSPFAGPFGSTAPLYSSGSAFGSSTFASNLFSSVPSTPFATAGSYSSPANLFGSTNSQSIFSKDSTFRCTVTEVPPETTFSGTSTGTGRRSAAFSPVTSATTAALAIGTSQSSSSATTGSVSPSTEGSITASSSTANAGTSLSSSSATISTVSPSIKGFTNAPPSTGDDIVTDDQQESKSVEKVLVDQMSETDEDQDEKQGTTVGEMDSAEPKISSSKEEDHDHKPPDNSSNKSEVFDADEIVHSGLGSLKSPQSTSCADFKDFMPSLENAVESQYVPIVEQILNRYGDISKDSIPKSVEAKAAFFQLVAKVVEQLRNLTTESLSSGKLLQKLQEWTDDAKRVGFEVEWLQQRLKKVVAASTYQVSLKQLNELNERISATKIALTEMELQQITLKEEVDAMKVQIDGANFDGSNLCEGLF